MYFSEILTLYIVQQVFLKPATKQTQSHIFVDIGIESKLQRDWENKLYLLQENIQMGEAY